MNHDLVIVSLLSSFQVCDFSFVILCALLYSPSSRLFLLQMFCAFVTEERNEWPIVDDLKNGLAAISRLAVLMNVFHLFKLTTKLFTKSLIMIKLCIVVKYKYELKKHVQYLLRLTNYAFHLTILGNLAKAACRIIFVFTYSIRHQIINVLLFTYRQYRLS